MMRRFLPLGLLTAFLFLIAGCGKKQFVVDFRLNADVDGNYRIMFYASDSRQGFWMESMAPIEHGVYSLTAPVVNPCLVYILDRHSGLPKAIFYAERGDKITVSGEGQDPAGWKITGNKLTEEWSDWRLANLQTLNSGSSAQINRCVSSYVKKNSGNRLAPLLLLTTFVRAGSEEEFMSLWNTIPKRVRNEKAVSLASAPELASSAPFVTSDDYSLQSSAERKIKPFRLHSLANGVDTVNTSAAPTIILLWHSQDDKRAESIMALKELVKEFPDSAVRNIVDISLDPDSLSWMGSCSPDSLSKSVRGWVPEGEASPLVMRMGVASTPRFVVLRRGGEPAYSGTDADKATAVFRKLRPRKL